MNKNLPYDEKLFRNPPQPDTTPDGGNKTGRQDMNLPKKAILLLIAMPYLAVTDSCQAFGVIFGIAAGIGAAYITGSIWEWSTTRWVLAGAVSALVTYAYLWPLVYLFPCLFSLKKPGKPFRSAQGHRRPR